MAEQGAVTGRTFSDRDFAWRPGISGCGKRQGPWRQAAALAVALKLGSLDSLHLAAAHLVSGPN
jgi:hypothetical protein